MAKKNRKKQKEAGERSGGSEMTKFYVILGVVAVIAVGAVGYSVGTGSMGAAVTAPVEVEGLDDTQRLLEVAQPLVKGDENAPITIVEFGDYQCPGCAAFARMVEPQIDAAWVESGEAKFVYYDFPLTNIHPNAFLAARAARCAGDQDRYWEYHSALFGNQTAWAASSSPTGLYVDYAEDLGLDAGAFESCLKSDRHAATVTANLRLGEELGVNGTPTVMVSQGEGMARRVPGNRFEQIQGVVEEIQASMESGGEEASGEEGSGDGGG